MRCSTPRKPRSKSSWSRAASYCPSSSSALPLRFEGKLFNCAAVVHRGRLLGMVPKTYLPNYREFYEKRQFTSGRHAIGREVPLFGERVPFGSDLLFEAEGNPDLCLHVEICEDVWAPIPPSTYGRRWPAPPCSPTSRRATSRSARPSTAATSAPRSPASCIAAYLYSAAGPGESTTDLAWDGHALIYENDELLAESRALRRSEEQLIAADIDLERLRQERMRMTSFNDCAAEHRERGAGHAARALRLRAARRRAAAAAPGRALPLRARRPGDARRALLRGLQHPGARADASAWRRPASRRSSIGVSGGLDSTQALIVAAKTMDRLGLPRANILALHHAGLRHERPHATRTPGR